MGLFDQLKNKAQAAMSGAVNDVGKAITQSAGAKTEKIVLSDIPTSASAMQAAPEFSLQNPYAVAAFGVAALCVYPQDKEAAVEMLNVLRGPNPMSPHDIQFLRDRFMDGKDYKPRSYFEGAKPENDYLPSEPYTITIKEQSNSRDQENMVTLYLTSGGADSARPVTLRHKPSTNEWFLWEYASLLLDIRIPKSADAWA